jgi:ribosome-associated protein
LASEALVELAIRTIINHKGLEPVALKVKELCSFADYFIICAGTSRRHVAALAQNLEEDLAHAGIKPLGVEGIQEGQWVLLDYNDVVIHIFLQALREFYHLEGLWSEAPHVPLPNTNYAPAPSLSVQKTMADPDGEPEQQISHE